jgi:lipoate---protein ligase
MRFCVDLRPMDPALGLAMDETLLDANRQHGLETARVWINDRAVVVGRSQHVASEVDEERAKAMRIPVLRRISGGGAVFHYPGNLNLSIVTRTRNGLSHASDVFAFYGAWIAEALNELGCRLHAQDNGLYVEGLKVGGAAQARWGDSMLYHTTLLLQPPPVPMDTLLLAMRPDYCPSGVASRPRVMTWLSDHVSRPMDADDVVEPIRRVLACAMGVRMTEARPTSQEAARAEALRDTKYGSLSWIRKW